MPHTVSNQLAQTILLRENTIMNIQWNTVTWYSKLAALLFFLIVFPMIAFGIGREYQKTVQFLAYTTKPTQPQNTEAAKKQYSGIRGTTNPESLVAIKHENGGYSETVSNSDGSFIIFLNPGTYVVKTPQAETEVEVTTGTMSKITLIQK